MQLSQYVCRVKLNPLLLWLPGGICEQEDQWPSCSLPNVSQCVSDTELLHKLLACQTKVESEGLSNYGNQVCYFFNWLNWFCLAGLPIHQTGTPNLFTCFLPEKILPVFYPKVPCSLQQGCLMLAQDQTSVPEGDEVHQQIICYSLSNSITTFASICFGRCQCSM